MNIYNASLFLFFAILIIPIFAQINITNTYNKYSKVNNLLGYTGAEVARRILDANDLESVRVVESHGHLTDHYDPRTRTVALSSSNFNSTSLAGTAVAAHEVGHAIQHKESYSFLNIRSALVPLVQFSSNISYLFVLIGVVAQATNLLLVGIVLIAIGVIFQFVTLPVEFNASSRAMTQIATLGLVEKSQEAGARKVLSAAALTYVAGALVALLSLLRLVLIFLGQRRND